MISDAININGHRYVLREDYDVLAARCERADQALLTERGKLEKADELTQTLMERCEALEMALDPRRWDQPLSDAWHVNIPDTIKAFRALRDLCSVPADGERQS